MKRFFESFTLLQLIVLGFVAVILPLAVAISIAVVQSEEFAASSREALVSVQTSTDMSRRLASRIRDLERSARQYLALDDTDVLARYRGHRREVLDLLAILRSLAGSIDIAYMLDEIGAAEQDLNRHIELPPTAPRALGADALARGDAVASTANTAGLADRRHTRDDLSFDARRGFGQVPAPMQELEAAFRRLRATSMELLALYSRQGRELSNELPRQASRQRSSLVLLAVMVIPLSLLLAGVFLVLASRPLRQLDSSIRTLGGGVLTTPIEIRGARDLVELGHRLDWLRTRLMALEEQKLRFLRDVSHELKTPLTNIREASGLLLDGPQQLGDRETATITRILHENGLRLQSLIEELLRFGAADGNASGGALEPLPLHELVLETLHKQEIAAQARKLCLHTALSPATVLGNPRQLEIIVDNLLSNAIKFSPECGRIDVRLGHSGEQVHLDVIDAGPGVAPEHREAIFEWFFRGGADAHAVVAGSGMGLAIAREYARLHAGTLQLLPSQRGAHFRLSLQRLAAGE